MTINKRIIKVFWVDIKILIYMLIELKRNWLIDLFCRWNFIHVLCIGSKIYQDSMKKKRQVLHIVISSFWGHFLFIESCFLSFLNIVTAFIFFLNFINFEYKCMFIHFHSHFFVPLVVLIALFLLSRVSFPSST